MLDELKRLDRMAALARARLHEAVDRVIDDTLADVKTEMVCASFKARPGLRDAFNALPPDTFEVDP